MNSKQNIIFFDGHCGLCDRFVTKIFSQDHKHRFYFAPLQGPTARQLLPSPIALESVIYWKEGRVLKKSQAVLEILSDLGGLYAIFKIFRFVPKQLRDFAYDFIARHRYGWFGESESCRLPQPTEIAYFLD